MAVAQHFDFKLVADTQLELGIRNQFEVEVLSYGHLPLAYSARCFTARSEDRPKDECETCCIKYPTGRSMGYRRSRSWSEYH